MSSPRLPNSVAVPSGRVASGSVRVPPSKSVSHRYFNLTLLSGRSAVIENPLQAEDLALFSRALEQLGYSVAMRGGTLRLEPPQTLARQATIDCGNAGTMYRFLVAALTTLEGEWVLTGTPRLAERPIGPLVGALRRLGANIECLEKEGYAPLRIRGATLRGGTVDIDASESSQFLSALLMAASRASVPVDIRVLSLSSSPYLDLTLEAVALFGGVVERPHTDRFVVHPGPLEPGELEVEGDFSAATYPAAAALLTGGTVLLKGLRESSKQGDRRFIDLLVSMGAEAAWSQQGLRVSGRLIEATEADLRDMPDQVPTLAAIAPFLEGTTRISNVPQLRVKESDRLAVMARELGRVGARVSELPDGLVIEGSWSRGEPPGDRVVVDPQDDHRIAMSLALVGLRRPGIVIGDAHVVGKSYPNFWRDLDTLVG